MQKNALTKIQSNHMIITEKQFPNSYFSEKIKNTLFSFSMPDLRAKIVQ